MGTKAKNQNLNQAKTAKKDEFYTQLADIERELKHYKRHFKGKVVYCNCDDPRVSGFFHYFAYNFEKLGLKKLITTCYKSQDVNQFSKTKAERAVLLEYTGDKNGNRVPDAEEIGIVPLKGDGDFRSEKSIELLKQADIVVTNPPFSLFREYVAQLVQYKKKFIIVGSLNAVKYKEIFPLIMKNKLWLGYGFKGGSSRFATPYSSELVKFGNVTWFTNLAIRKRNEGLILYETYNPEEYPTYANFDAIEVSKTKKIPVDYDGLMGVPISFLSKYNPKQFELVGVSQSWFGAASKIYSRHTQVSADGRRSYGTTLNAQPALEVASPPTNKTYYVVDGKYYVATYCRLLIKRKNG